MKNLFNTGAIILNGVFLTKNIKRIKNAETNKEKTIAILFAALDIASIIINLKSLADANFLPEDDEDEIEE